MTLQKNNNFMKFSQHEMVINLKKFASCVSFPLKAFFVSYFY